MMMVAATMVVDSGCGSDEGGCYLMKVVLATTMMVVKVVTVVESGDGSGGGGAVGCGGVEMEVDLGVTWWGRKW